MTLRHFNWSVLVGAVLLACGMISNTATFCIAADVAPADKNSAADTDKKSADKDKTDQDSADAKAANKDDKTDGDEQDQAIKVPDGTPEELLKFIATTKSSAPAVRTQLEVRRFYTRQQTAILTAADKILAAKPEADVEAKALAFKLDARLLLNQLGDKPSGEALAKLVDQLKDDERAEVAAKAQYVLILSRLRELNRANPERLAKQVDEMIAGVQKQLDRGALDPQFLRLAQIVARVAEQADPKLGIKAYETFIASIKKSDTPEAKQAVESMEGALRFLSLAGKPMDIEGTLLNGDKFDWPAYKGKVVLVDFWATWCGPCIGELPNVKATYEKFHDRGFDVVGISLDNDKSTLEKFVTDQELPWPILFGDNADAAGWQHPMAVKYGISAIPAAILIGRDGNVIDLNARGEKLADLVAAQVGDGKDADDAKSPASDAKDPTGESDKVKE